MPAFLSAIDRLLNRGVFAHLAVLAVLGFAAYLTAINLPFVHDDVVFIQQNPHIHRWDNIGEAFVRPSMPQFFNGLVTPYYRPVLEILYRLQFALFGLNPSGYHLFNILVHIFNGFLVYSILRHLCRAPKMALLGAAIFIVHPVQTEAVACISGISNLACAFFMLLAFDGYLRAQAAAARRQTLWLLYGLAAFAAALMTKEQAVILPLILVWYEIFISKDRRIPVMMIRLTLFALLLLGFLLLRHALFGSMTTAVFENMAELKLRLLSLPRLLEIYAGLVVFPSGLHYYRSIDILAPNGLSWLFLAVIAVAMVSLLKFFKTGRGMMCFGLGWFLWGLVPVLNIVPLVNEYSFLAAAEHNLYFPIIGFLIFLSAIVGGVFPRLSRFQISAGKIFIVVLIVGMAAASMVQNRFWQNEIVLFKRVLEFEPHLGRVRILLAKAYFQEGKLQEALHEYRQAQKIMDGYVQKAASKKALLFYHGMLKGIYSDSARAYAGLRDFASSIAYYNRALLLDPSDSHLYSNRALSFIAQGDGPSGIKDLETAIQLDPNNLYAANNLSICLIQKGELIKARDLLEKIVSQDPHFPAALGNLTRLRAQMAGENR